MASRPLDILYVISGRQLLRQIRLFQALAGIAQADGHRVRFYAVEAEVAPVSRGLPSAIEIDGVSHDIPLVPMPEASVARGFLARKVEPAYMFYEAFKTDPPDVVHCMDISGIPFYAQLAKQQGLNFVKTRFIVHATGGRMREYLRQFRSVADPSMLCLFHAERMTIANADSLVAPSAGLLREIEELGYSLPAQSVTVRPPPDLFTEFDGRAQPVSTLVLAPTDHSRRAIALLATIARRAHRAGFELPPIVIVINRTKWRDTRRYARRLFSRLPVSMKVEVRDGWPAFLEICEGVTAPLIFHPFPNPVWLHYELSDLAQAGYPVLLGQADICGEFLTEESCAVGATDSYLPDAFVERLRHVQKTGAPLAALKADSAAEAAYWSSVYRSVPANSEAQAPDTVQPSPLVTVAIIHFERPRLIHQAIDSVLSQTYPNLEVVLVDDGSQSKAAREMLDAFDAEYGGRGWRTVRQDNRYLGAARNAAARAARGEYVFFLDDDNILKPNAIATLVEVAERTGTPIVGSFSEAFDGDTPPDPNSVARRRIIQLGGDSGFGIFRNGILDGNSLCHRDTYLRLGGNTEHYGIGKDDQEFFVHAILSGVKTTIVPEALYLARQAIDRLKATHFDWTAGHFRVLNAYWKHVPPEIQPLLYLLQGNLIAEWETGPLYWQRRSRRLWIRALFRPVRLVVRPIVRGTRHLVRSLG